MITDAYFCLVLDVFLIWSQIWGFSEIGVTGTGFQFHNTSRGAQQGKHDPMLGRRAKSREKYAKRNVVYFYTMLWILYD